MFLGADLFSWGPKADYQAARAKLADVVAQAQQLRIMRVDWQREIDWNDKDVLQKLTCADKGGRWDSQNNMCLMSAADVGSDPLQAITLNINNLSFLNNQIRSAVDKTPKPMPDVEYPAEETSSRDMPPAVRQPSDVQPSGGGYISSGWGAPEQEYPGIGVSAPKYVQVSPEIKAEIAVKGPVKALTTPGPKKEASWFSLEELMKILNAGAQGYSSYQKQVAAAQLMSYQQQGGAIQVDPKTKESVKSQDNTWMYATAGIVVLGLAAVIMMRD